MCLLAAETHYAKLLELLAGRQAIHICCEDLLQLRHHVAVQRQEFGRVQELLEVGFRAPRVGLEGCHQGLNVCQPLLAALQHRNRKA